MTIKKRLFWSNILMIVIPVALSTIIAYAILFLFTRNSEIPMERAFPMAYESMMNYRRTGDLEDLRRSVDVFNDRFQEQEVVMAILKDNEFLYPQLSRQREEGRRLLPFLLDADVTGSVQDGDTRFFIERFDEYRILLIDSHTEEAPSMFHRPLLLHLPLIFAAVLAVILLTNRLLTHLLAKRITEPLGYLADGARQLGEGNLDYRIAYSARDEFAPVCDDFNEMADQLQELISYQQRNERSRKELLAGISHDLRTPLTSIRAYVEGLLDGVAEDLPSQLKYLGIIRNKAEDIDKLVDKLFLFSKLDIGELPVNLEQVDIGEELSAMVASVGEEYSEKGLDLELVDRVEGVLIETDTVHLHNVLLNILENSLRYREKERGTVYIRCFVEDCSVEIQLTDDGPGVQEEDLEKIFEVFYRGDPSRQNPSKGSGLGLAISTRMMSRIGGSIQAENAPEGGLRMILRLPRQIAETGQEGERT